MPLENASLSQYNACSPSGSPSTAEMVAYQVQTLEQQCLNNKPGFLGFFFFFFFFFSPNRYGQQHPALMLGKASGVFFLV
jgi:hypothetical protein